MKGCVVENSDKGSDKGRRDGALTTAEVRQLLQRSAGLCEFENCAKPLFYDLVSGETCNDGQYAISFPRLLEVRVVAGTSLRNILQAWIIGCICAMHIMS